MGKGRDKRKKHEDPAKAAQRAAKQHHKLSKKDRRADGEESSGVQLYNEESIEDTLKRIQKTESRIKTVEEVEGGAPSARVNVVMVPHPVRENELLIFGGEFYNGEITEAYNDLFFYHTKRNTWAKLSTSVNPPPRSSSQGVIYKEFMIIFGGEFVSQSQSQFLHFRDVWRFDAKRSEWTELKQLKGPSSRSGHRMVLWKRQAVLFGGFYDNAQECHYFNDLWILSSLEGSGKWESVEISPGSEAPAPRSGHNMSILDNTVFVYGGYSTQKFNRFKKSEATVHHDLWMAHLPQEATDGKKRVITWVRVKLDGVPPPIRCGVGSTFKDKRMYLFGGVVDIESPGGKMVSTFANDLFVFHMDSKRFYPVVLRRKAHATGAADGPKGRVNDLGAELKALQLGSEGNSSSSDDEAVDFTDDNEQAQANSREMKESFETNRYNQITPHRRMDASLVCVGNYLYVFGGLFESEKKEISMKDMYALNLNRLETFDVLLSQDLSAAVWMGKDTESNAASWESGSTVASAAFDFDYLNDEEEDDGDGEENGAGDGEVPALIPAAIDHYATPALDELPSQDGLKRTGKKGLKVHKEQLLAQLGTASSVPTPTSEETFQTFYTRTDSFWLAMARDAHDGKRKEKKVVSEAVEFARRRFHEAKELLQQLSIVEEHERMEIAFFRERREEKEREWEEWRRQNAANEKDDDDENKADEE